MRQFRDEHVAGAVTGYGGSEHFPVGLGPGMARIQRHGVLERNCGVEGALHVKDLLVHEVEAEKLIGVDVVEDA